jgi:hypothetical protein
MATWPPLNPDMTDYPAIYPHFGRFYCGDGCATGFGRQDFETCAMGILPSGQEINIGCVHWGHICNFRYESVLIHIHYSTGHGGCFANVECNCSSTIQRYPGDRLYGITPQPPKPGGWDPSVDQPTWPGGFKDRPRFPKEQSSWK